ncbi:hypothetical protein NQ318_015435 [Aromia moschata]|uniref:FOXO protein transactivation domain-containing protein n=1 Tax=Aromia moschata TaxID=1265417 RepID=A0AAV8YRW7_9CUCU|nr:hypothetical protein NQ318_015435 [Aromia moschata]
MGALLIMPLLSVWLNSESNDRKGWSHFMAAEEPGSDNIGLLSMGTPRAASNPSSCGQLSPIPSIEPVWNPSDPYNNPDYSPEMVSSGNYSPDQLARNLDQGMKLQTAEFMGRINQHQYRLKGHQLYRVHQRSNPTTTPASLHCLLRAVQEINTLHATSPYGLTQWPIHRMQSCSCIHPIKVESMSPAGMSPSYPHSEPSPDLSSQYPMINRIPRTPSTMMGQLMGALHSSTAIDEININVDSLQGGFDCNVDEVINHTLNMDGNLDFNFSTQQQGDERTAVVLGDGDDAVVGALTEDSEITDPDPDFDLIGSHQWNAIQWLLIFSDPLEQVEHYLGILDAEYSPPYSFGEEISESR